MTLEESDREAGAVAKAERVTLGDLENKIANKWFVTGHEATIAYGDERDEFAPFDDERVAEEALKPLEVLTICIVVTTSGFTLIGKSAPAAPENFNADLGKKFAYEDVLKQLWPLEGYLLRERLSEQP